MVTKAATGVLDLLQFRLKIFANFTLGIQFMSRPSGRRPEQLRQVKITRDYTCHAEGSVLVEFGNTKVICTASVENGVPRFSPRQRGGLGDCRIRYVAAFNE